MKRLFILGFTVMAFGASLFANENNVVEKLNNSATQKAVVRYLDADNQQGADLKYIFGEASKRYERAKAKGASSEEASKKAINFNLANARVILSSDQYRKFVTILNITVINNADNSLFAEK